MRGLTSPVSAVTLAEVLAWCGDRPAIGLTGTGCAAELSPDTLPPALAGPETPEAVARLESALAYRDADAPYPEWMRTLACIHATEWERAEDVARAWSARGAKYCAAEFDRVWRSLRADKPGGAGLGTFIREAKAAGWIDPGLPPHQPASAEGPSFNVSRPGDWNSNAGRDPIWRGRAAIGDLIAIIAQPYSGKSLLAPYLAWQIARGDDTFGRQTVRTRAAWFAVEDSHGAADRMEAMRRQWGESDGFRLITPGEGGFSLLRDVDVEALRRLVKREGFGLLIIDTLSAAAPGHRENDVEHVSQTIARLRRITRIPCTVIITHHLAKQGDRENPSARGSGDLQAAFDVAIALVKERDSDRVSVRIVKNRNGPPGAFAFRIGTVDLGAQDRWGEPIKAPVVAEELSFAEAKDEKPLSRPAAALLRIVENEGGAMSRTTLAEKATAPDAVSPAGNRDSRQTAVRRALRELESRGEITVGPEGNVRVADDWCEGDQK